MWRSSISGRWASLSIESITPACTARRASDALEIQVRWGAIDLEDRSGFGRKLEETIDVEVVPGTLGTRPVHRVRHDRHERMLHHRFVPPEQSGGEWPARSCNDARTMSNRRSTRSGKSSRSVGEDVDFGAVEDRNLRVTLAHGGDLVGLPRHVVDREVPGRG